MFTPVPTPAEMSRWDANTIAMGVPEAVLMENAARAAMDCLRRHIPFQDSSLEGKSILILAGSGNNGGDAFCMARHLLQAGARPALACVRSPRPGGAAALWFDVLQQLGIPFVSAEAWLSGNAPDFYRSPDVIIDGLLGTGFKGSLRELELSLVEKLDDMHRAFIVSIDIPSGLDGMTGMPCPKAVHAHVTATFQAPKPGLLMPQAAEYTGLLEICPIGMPGKAMEMTPASFRTWLMPGQRRGGPDTPWVLHRGMEQLPAMTGKVVHRHIGPAHKGEAGRVLVIGGCPAYTGAPCLSALAAMRTGAGLVSVAAPAPASAALRTLCPAAISIVLPERPAGQSWRKNDAECLANAMQHADAVVFGPGLGRGQEEEYLAETLINLPQRPPMVIDADALFALSRKPWLLERLKPNDVLTPHPGEAAAMLGSCAATVQANRMDALRSLTKLTPAVCVLKGEGTLIGARNAASIISPWCVPQLAVAGSGDLLAGTTAALLARRGQPDNPVEKAALAVWIHALAGAELAAAFPLRGNSPQDIADAMPHAMAAAGIL